MFFDCFEYLKIVLDDYEGWEEDESDIREYGVYLVVFY